MSQDISIQFTRFSAFYSPLIATMAGGFLEQEGLRSRHSVAAPGTSAIAHLKDRKVNPAANPVRGARARRAAQASAFGSAYNRAYVHSSPRLLRI